MISLKRYIFLRSLLYNKVFFSGNKNKHEFKYVKIQNLYRTSYPAITYAIKNQTHLQLQLLCLMDSTGKFKLQLVHASAAGLPENFIMLSNTTM